MSDTKTILKQAQDALDSAIIHARQKRTDEDRKYLIASLGQDMKDVLRPLLSEIAQNSRYTKEELKNILKTLSVEKIDVKMPDIKVPEIKMPAINIPKISIPDIKIPTINVPQPKVTVNVPDIKIPDINMPDEMDIKGWVRLQGVDLDHPLPVQLRDANGRQVNLLENLTTLVGGGGGGGGKKDYLTIKGFSQSAFSEIMNPDGRVKVELLTEASLTDNELRASSVPVAQASGTKWSTEASQAGIWNIATLTGVTNSVAASIVDSSGVQYSGSNPVPTTLISDGAGLATAAKQLVDGHNVTVDNTAGAAAVNIQDGGNTITIDGTVAVSGSITSTVVVGSVVADAVDDGSAPVQSGGIARTANPTAVASGDVVKASYDDVGRQLTKPIQVRDAVATAYVAASTGTETTLLAAAAGYYHDLIYVLASNNSTVAVGVDIRAVTAGNIQMHLEVPANGVVGVSLPTPMPGMLTDGTGNNWTVDLPDITGTTLYVSALFSKEV